MRKIILNLSFFLCVVFHIAYAQENVEFVKEKFPNKKDEFKDALKNLEKGDDEYNNEYSTGAGKYRRALPFYKQANRFNSDNAELNYKIGVCYMFTPQKVNAIKYLEKALQLDPDVNKEAIYLLGSAYQLEYAFDIAIEKFKEYLNALSAEQRFIEQKKVNKHILECELGKSYLAERTRAFIDNIGKTVNSRYPDYGPLISADESVLIFTSRRETSMGGELSEIDQDFFEDIYISYNDGNEWTEPANMGAPINTDIHDATVNLTADGQKLFIYKDLGYNKGAGDIFECKLEGNEWSKPKKLPKAINSDFHESSACYSHDGKRIYFITDKPGGIGGRDIYYSDMDEKGKWGEAVNMGETLNTTYDEEGIFISHDGKTMYFSSQGHESMGGYDIFKSKLKDDSWSEPINLGYPINTPDNDVYFVVAANGKHAYYASERLDGLGEKDIYKVTLLGPEKPVVLNTEDNLLANEQEPLVSNIYMAPVVAVEEHLPTILKGKVLDEISLKPVQASIELVDNEKNEIVGVFESNSETGKYLVTLPSGYNYGIAVKAEGYLFHSENFDIPEVSEYREIVKDVRLKSIKVGSKIVLKNVFFDTDKSVLRPSSYAELERLTKLLTDFSKLKVEISGHTDNVGTKAYNQKLSEARAKTIVDYLVKAGVDVQRLEYKGYGMDAPIANNDTEAGRQENRRTEFKILED